jgi:hypothetical protein
MIEQALTFVSSNWRKHIYPYLGLQFHSCFSIWDRDNKRMKIIKWQINMKKQISHSCANVGFCQFYCLHNSDTVTINLHVITLFLIWFEHLNYETEWWMICGWAKIIANYNFSYFIYWESNNTKELFS